MSNVGQIWTNEKKNVAIDFMYDHDLYNFLPILTTNKMLLTCLRKFGF